MRLHHRCQSGQFFLEFSFSGLCTFLHGKMRLDIRKERKPRGGCRYIQTQTCKIDKLSERSRKCGFTALIGACKNKELFSCLICKIVTYDLAVTVERCQSKRDVVKIMRFHGLIFGKYRRGKGKSLRKHFLLQRMIGQIKAYLFVKAPQHRHFVLPPRMRHAFHLPKDLRPFLFQDLDAGFLQFADRRFGAKRIDRTVQFASRFFP